MNTAHVYIWPERGDVDYFLSKLVPKGQIADWIRIRESTADTAMASRGLTQTMMMKHCIREVFLPHSPKQRCQSISNSGRQVKSRIRR